LEKESCIILKLELAACVTHHLLAFPTLPPPASDSHRLAKDEDTAQHCQNFVVSFVILQTVPSKSGD
jgi:hypothetical protein